MNYSATVNEHFNNPRNVGTFLNADAIGEATNPVCLDRMKLFLRISSKKITEACYQVEGCVPSIAAGSVLCGHISGMNLDEAGLLTPDALEDLLGGLPATKKHAAYLAVDALMNALESFRLNSHEQSP